MLPGTVASLRTGSSVKVGMLAASLLGKDLRTEARDSVERAFPGYSADIPQTPEAVSGRVHPFGPAHQINSGAEATKS
jgi:hypothetical protein